jgi:3D-(3,5/4)-trihydroxycyclohexane-1,2-dione acylhydrolase (decyclizing)
MTVAQAVVEFLGKQYTADNVGGAEYRERLIPGMFGIFGHGNVAGVGQALKQWQVQDPTLMPYYQGRNEQAQVHQSVGYARHMRRRATFAISSSIGPGSSNLLTGAALATTNRLPVLLLPSDTFATRAADPVLQQLERPDAYDITVNDAFRPLSKYFDRVTRPEQLFSAFHHGLRVLTDPAETGTVTISLPQDVQAEVLDVPEEFLAEREWRIRRPEPEEADIRRAAQLIRAAKRPLIIAGGGGLHAGRRRSVAVGCTVLPGRSRVHGHDGGQHRRPRSRPDHRHRNPLRGLHHRFAHRIPEPGRAVRQHQRGPDRRV